MARAVGRLLEERCDTSTRTGQQLTQTTAELSQKMMEVDALLNYMKVEVEKKKEKEQGKFQFKDAQNAKPGAWDEVTPFMDYMMEVKTWADALH